MMTSKPPRIVAPALGLVLAWASAVLGAPETLSLEDCLERALAHNPRLLASHELRHAAEARVTQALAIPQPTLDYDSDMQPEVLDLDDSGETYLGLSQTVEFPGRRSLRIKIAREESAAVVEEVESRRQELILEVKTAFYALLLAEQQREHARRNLELASEFEELAAVRYETGDVARVETMRAEVELARARSELRQALNEAALAAARLGFLLGGGVAEPLTVDGDLRRPPLEADEDELVAKALAARPEVRALRHALAREELAEKQARRSVLPDVDLGVAEHRIDGEGSFWDVTVSVPVPIFRQQYRGELAEARANQGAVKFELEHLEQTVALEVLEAHRAAVTARDQLDLFNEELLAEAREVYDMYLFSYREGEIGGIELIEARRSLIEARTSYAVALYDYAVAVAALERAVGQAL